MSTYILKAGQVDRKWYMIDTVGKSFGRAAVQAAILLRGKCKPTFAPHVDCGDHVVIVNSTKAVLTGSRFRRKYYCHHIDYIGNLKEVRYDTLMREELEKAVELAVEDMIPDTTIGRGALTRLRVYAGAERKHNA